MTHYSLSARTAPPETALLVRVQTFICTGMGQHGYKVWELESEKIVNHNDDDDRKWMGRHCFWCFRNDRKVVTQAA